MTSPQITLDQPTIRRFRAALQARLPNGLTARAGGQDDAHAVCDVIAASELVDDGTVEIDLDDILAEWARSSFDVGRDGVVIESGHDVVAFATVFQSRRADAAVTPEFRGRGIGSGLLRWTQWHALAGGGTRVGQTVTDNNTAARDLFVANGYVPLWNSWILVKDVRDEPPPPALPEGLVLRPFDPGTEERDVHDLIERAFSEWPSRHPMSFEDWRTSILGRAWGDASLVPVIVHGDRIAGVAVCLDYEDLDSGWVQQLAVDAAYRGRGLGGTLLSHCFAMFRGRGRTTCELATDSRTGALGLYEHVGMRIRRSYTHYAKELRGSGGPSGGHGGGVPVDVA